MVSHDSRPSSLKTAYEIMELMENYRSAADFELINKLMIKAGNQRADEAWAEIVWEWELDKKNGQRDSNPVNHTNINNRNKL